MEIQHETHSNSAQRIPVRPLILVGLLMSAMSGCAEYSRKANPVISANLNKEVSALSTGAERRIVLSQKRYPNESKERSYRVCAEPSPDAIEALAASLDRSFSLKNTENQTASAQSLETLATATTITLRKSQGLQLFRDGVFALCQGAMNGIEDDKDIKEAFEGLLAASVMLIKEEFKTKGWNNPPDIKVVKADPVPQSQKPSSGGN